MGPSGTFRCFGAALALVAFAALPALTARADLEAWDPEKVLAAAQQLHTAVKDVRLKIRQEPVAGTPVQNDARQQLEITLRDLEKSSSQLVARLEGGGGRAETLNIARKIKMLVNDVRMYWRRMMTTETSDIATEPATQALAVLAPYYFERKRAD